MDANVSLIANYANSLHFSDLPDSVVHQCKRCMIDTMGCALGALDAEPSRIALNLAKRVSVVGGAPIIGTAHRTLPELAAFANGVMARYLDANDTYVGGGGHPSDTMAAVLAAASISNAAGRTVIAAMVISYEVYMHVYKAVRLRDIGMDNILYTTIGSSVGAAKVLGLDTARMAEAISLAITPNVPLDATRYGHLSMWKGCAGGNAARSGVFAALLAADGMTGPEKPIEGAHGLQNLAGGFASRPFSGNDGPYGISEVTFKVFSAVSHALSPITVALQLSGQFEAGDIESVDVYTNRHAWDVTGREPEKWQPSTRESADHSLPYIVAAVLLEGRFSEELLSAEYLRDSRIRQLIDKIKVFADEEITSQSPQKLPCRIEVTTKTGERKVAATDYPRGHHLNPMTDAEVNGKFRGFARKALLPERVEEVLDILWHLDSATDLSALFTAMECSR